MSNILSIKIVLALEQAAKLINLSFIERNHNVNISCHARLCIVVHCNRTGQHERYASAFKTAGHIMEYIKFCVNHCLSPTYASLMFRPERKDPSVSHDQDERLHKWNHNITLI